MPRWLAIALFAAASLVAVLLVGFRADGESAAPAAPSIVFVVGGSDQSDVPVLDGAPATSGWLQADAVAAEADGGLLVASGNRVRRIGLDGIVRTVAGDGRTGFAGDGGRATAARLGNPMGGLAALPDGGFLVLDATNHRVRRVWPDGRITTVAGAGEAGASSAGRPVVAARLPADPGGFAATPDGGFVIVDARRGLLKRMRADGTISTIATGVFSPFLTVRADGTVLWSDIEGNRVLGVGPDGRRLTLAGIGVVGHSGDGGPATKARLAPGALAVASDGSVLVADGVDGDSPRIRRITPDGRIGTIVGGAPPSLAAGESPDGRPARTVAVRAGALAAAPDGGLYVTDVFADELDDADGNLLVDSPTTVLYLPGAAGQRLALSATIAASSPPMRFRVALTLPATLQATLRHGGRVIARTSQQLPAVADRPIALPRVPTGPYRVDLRAATGGYRIATHDDTAYLGSRLTLRWGRRFARHYIRMHLGIPGAVVGRCRHFTTWRVDCTLVAPATGCRQAVAVKVEQHARQAWLVARPYRCSALTPDRLQRHPHYLAFVPLDQAALADAWRDG
jgi:DNA-binding beta-propeller fold protein YncE